MTKTNETWKSGQSFDDYLRERGLYEIVTFHALASYLVDLNSEQSESNSISTKFGEIKYADVG